MRILFSYLRAIRLAASFAPCGVHVRDTDYDDHDDYDYDDPPPAYEETETMSMGNNVNNVHDVNDVDDAVPLGVLVLCAKQIEFNVYSHYVLSPNVQLLIIGPDGSARDRFVQDFYNLSQRVRIATFERASTGDVYDTDGWTPTHLAIYDASDNELSQFYASWKQKLRFPSRECFIEVLRRTTRLRWRGCLIVDVSSNHDIQDRLMYYETSLN